MEKIFLEVYKDLHNSGYKEENPLKLFPFGFYGHYNIDGYKKVATKINELIENRENYECLQI